MKAHEALIAWTPPNEKGSATAGMVEVGPLLRKESDHDWTEPYSRVGGALYIERCDWRGDRSVAQLFIDFHTLVVADGIDPQVAHQAFLPIDEYAESICPDLKGAREHQAETTSLAPRGGRSINRTDFKKQQMHGLPWTASSFTKKELKEWVASRQEAGRAIDIATCEPRSMGGS